MTKGGIRGIIRLTIKLNVNCLRKERRITWGSKLPCGPWRTHDGLDIAAELGTPVAACAKGTVTDVSTDDMMGVTVTVDHGKGMESVYSNLAESVNVQPGTEVEAGTVIGTVGTTAVSESADASHLHFSMREYGVAIDPLNYLH